jgi:S-adenosylmethionine decarboxylase proenzyme
MEKRVVLGNHLIAELWVKDPHLIDNPDHVRESLLAACHKGGFSVIKIAIHQFAPCGVTGMVLLSESHMSIHTWPEYGYAAVDIFTCGGAAWDALDELKRRLDVEHMDVQELDRGVVGPAEPRTASAAGYRAMDLS